MISKAEMMELVLQEAKQRIAEEDIEFIAVRGGSSSNSFVIKQNNRKIYLLKIQQYHELLERQEMIRHFLDCEDDHHQSLYMAYRSKKIPEAYISISNWLEGENLNLSDATITPTYLRLRAKEAAQIVRKIHEIRCPFQHERFDDKEDLKRSMAFIEKNLIIFPYKTEIMDMAARLSEKQVHSPYGFIHMDLHLENIIFSEKGCHLIDMETLCCGSVWRDLVYAIELNFPQERAFWKIFLEEYFMGQIPEEFWEEMLRYVLVAFLMLMKSNWNNQTMERQYNLAEKIYEDYEGFKRTIPIWFEVK